MALFLLKPILWNSNGYRRPSGTRASKESFPGKFGFGHEEWNNSPRLQFSEGGGQYRVFHTEDVGKAATEDYEGQTFVFMIASHGGVQDLVGVAGNAVFLGTESRRGDRQKLARQLKLRDLWKDAWAVPRVQRLFDGDMQQFKVKWAPGGVWLPNWLCPAEFFWWPDRPIRLDPVALIKKKRLPSMFTAYQELPLERALQVMESVPRRQRDEAWQRLVAAMQIAPSGATSVPAGPSKGRVTTQLRLALARCGQGKFREDLLHRWGGACAVTSMRQPEALRASHVKPWSSSTNDERLDEHNGLLLSANLDALFDVGLISFSDKGKMLVAPDVSPASRRALGIPSPLRKPPSPRLRVFLRHHREHVFRGGSTGVVDDVV